MRRLAVLLRAINVAGTGKLPMADFKACLAELGYGSPQTLGAAGSAVITTDRETAAVERELAQALDRRLGVATEVFARDGEEIWAALRGNPFDVMARERPAGLVFLFLSGEPQAADIEALRGKVLGPEEIAPGPRLLYVAYGEGMGRSKLSPALIERTIRLRGTGRNINTVRKLAELTA